MAQIIPPEIPQHSPLPHKAPDELSFPDAMRKVIDGERIARLSWNNSDFCLLKDGWLSIYTKGEFHIWSVNDGDLTAIDWVVLEDAN